MSAPYQPTLLERSLNAVGWASADRRDDHVFSLLTALVSDNQRLQSEVDKMWKVLNARTEHLV